MWAGERYNMLLPLVLHGGAPVHVERSAFTELQNSVVQMWDDDQLYTLFDKNWTSCYAEVSDVSGVIVAAMDDTTA